MQTGQAVKNVKLTAGPPQNYDLIVVGGGVYGICLAVEAAQQGLSTLLLERKTFGSSTSANTLRIIHGGLRYLQSLDLTRFRESSEQRRWFLETFPDAVKPHGFLMPLYGRGLRKRSIFRMALGVNNYLAKRFNEGLNAEQQIPNSRTLSISETVAMFPEVDQRGLKGGALWYDALMLNAVAVIQSMVKRAKDLGVDCREYVYAKRLVVASGQVAGVGAVQDQAPITFNANLVVNCAGPWSRAVAESFDRNVADLFFPMLAWNVLLDRKSLADVGLAVSPRNQPGRTCFINSEGGKLLAGTHYGSPHGDMDRPKPSDRQILEFLGELNESVPRLELTKTDILRIDAGLIPAVKRDSKVPRKRPLIYEHVRHGGPCGLFSVSGVKFTTARSVAQSTIKKICKTLNH